MAVFSSATNWQLVPFIGIRILVHCRRCRPAGYKWRRGVFVYYVAPRSSRLPYSVIPGGVGSADELRQISDHDPVVAQQFQGFDYANAHLVTVSEKQLKYVAFRKGDKVYWTRKKAALHPGETLISDGKIVARTRSGNRVAVAPLGPPALMDPLISDFDRPLSLQRNGYERG